MNEWKELKKQILSIKKNRIETKRLKLAKENFEKWKTLGKNIKYTSSIIIKINNE